ncbi:MAG: hypothetical protein BRD55_02545 [Bacteroidetes bacterium SW_9_63_38]|nr:MAG: hypothetical protein BRD55_02545 [Bacteroidetes bacterium SW_9_63_38]
MFESREGLVRGQEKKPVQRVIPQTSAHSGRKAAAVEATRAVGSEGLVRQNWWMHAPSKKVFPHGSEYWIQTDQGAQGRKTVERRGRISMNGETWIGGACWVICTRERRAAFV